MFARIPETPIFGWWERRKLKQNEFLSPYASITKRQLVGLLGALGEYFIRAGPDGLRRAFSDDPESAEMNRALGAHWHQIARTRAVRAGKPLFDAQERDRLSRHKYVRGSRHITKEELTSLLEILGRYSRRAPRIKQCFDGGGMDRVIHAHNALVTFRHRPFTEEEFSGSVRAVISGEQSALTRFAESEMRREIDW